MCHRDWISTTNALFISGQTVKRNHQEAASELWALSVVSHVSQPVSLWEYYCILLYQQALSSQLWTLTININMLSFSRTQGASSQTSISTSHIVPKLLFHDHSQSIKNGKLNKSISTLFSWINWSRYQISMRWLSPHSNPLHHPSLVFSYNMS